MPQAIYSGWQLSIFEAINAKSKAGSYFNGSKNQQSRNFSQENQKQPSRDVLRKIGVLKIRSKFRGEHPCQSVISIKLQSKFIEMLLQCGCCPVNVQHIFWTPFPKNNSRRLLLKNIRRKLSFVCTIYLTDSSSSWTHILFIKLKIAKFQSEKYCKPRGVSRTISKIYDGALLRK